MTHTIPPIMEADSRTVVVTFAGEEIARTNRATRVLEVGHPACWYIPPEDVRVEFLRRERTSTTCFWKGDATYYSVVVGGKVANNAAWCYPAIEPDYAPLQHQLAFYPARVDSCTVDGEAARPESGPYYGGWVLDDDPEPTGWT